MPNLLNEIVSSKKLEVERRKAVLGLEELKQTIAPADGLFLHALQKPGLKIIAELKPKSPSAGTLCTDFRVDEIVRVYNQYACAISVLTDEKFFGGGIELLAEVIQQSTLPVLCKDFIIDPYQCYLARSCGAQAVLLIVKILDQKELQQLYDQTSALGMTAVLEIQNEVELEQAMRLSPKPEVVLINNRNLEDFTISFDTTKALAPAIGDRAIVISASGLKSKTDVEELLPFCSTFLIGSTFMRSGDLEGEFKNLTDVCLASPTAPMNRGKN